jgi:ATP-binding cassette subfamily B protein
MALGGGRFGPMGAVWHQQRTIGYLREGKPDTRRTLGQVWQYLRVYRGKLALGTLVMILGVGVGLVPPLLIRELIDTAIPRHQLGLVLLLGGGMILFPVGNALLGLGQNYLSIVIAQGMIADLRSKLYRHTQSLGLDFFTWTRAGQIHTRFLNDAGGLQNVLTQSFIGTLGNLITLIGTLAIMVSINWQLTLITIVALPSFAFPILHFGKRRYSAMERAQEALSDLSVMLEETLSLSGTIVVKSWHRGTRSQALR